jgi:hypothetical protein
MKVSEKSLELNVGAELLASLRSTPRFAKAYLRGLTQREERQEGVDFFAQLPSGTRLFAFQFKAPKGKSDSKPLRYTIVRYQHDLLFQLAAKQPGSVFYVFPFYVTTAKLHKDLPQLSRDTWLLDVAALDTAATFKSYDSRTVACDSGTATINPEYHIRRLDDAFVGSNSGVDPKHFLSWYRSFREAMTEEAGVRRRRRNPGLARGLRVGIALP